MSTKLWGVDVSSHNGKIDWKAAKKAGVKFAFIRVGWSGYDGRIVHWNAVDKRFHENMKGAISAGIPVGVYVFSYTRTPAGAKIAAQEVLKLIKPYEVQLPVVFDMEVEGTDYASYTKATNTAIAKAFLTEVQKANYYAMFYTYKHFAENNINMLELSAFDTWIAQIASSLTYKGQVGVWQYSWKGRIAGFPTDVDMNYAYNDYPTIIRNAGLNGFSANKPVEPEEPSKPDINGPLVTVEKLQAQVDELIETIDAMDEVIAGLRRDIAEKDREILSLNREREETAILVRKAMNDFQDFEQSFMILADKY